MAAQVEVIISADGESAQISVKGVKGRFCQTLTEDLQKALGQTTRDLRTQEYYEKPAEVKQNARR